MLTAFLSRADVSRHTQALHLLRELREAFTSNKTASDGPQLHFSGAPGQSTVVQHATLEGFPAWSVTTRIEGPQGPRSLLQLHDAPSGKLLAVMDAGHVASMRAAMVSALAADVFARPDAKRVAILGTGAAVSSTLKALRLVRSLETVWFHEPNVAENFDLAYRLARSLSMAIHAADTVKEAVSNADLVVLTGGVSLGGARLLPGTHVTLLQAASFEKAPIAPELLARARRFGDAPAPASTWWSADASLGEALSGARPGRESPEQLTAFASFGAPQLDLLTAWHVFEGARHDEALTRIDLEA